ncbi:MAG TPA: voltage-gated chloride channel family protein [Acidobacteriaceae bacterium]|nr:voltage-gated chloride channel family protein [Acidobacteriaceae bacterium]
MSGKRLSSVLNDQFALFFDLIRWIPVALLVGILAGTASALLLASLNLATDLRTAHPWLILLLAPAGGLVGLLYRYFGTSVEAGNNLILEQTHDPTETIPLRMTPLILLGTFLTHLFGGSAGREGTAIQTGASLADQLARPFRMVPRDRRILLMAGIGAGFGSVFGTPLAGAVFGIEVLAIGKLSYDAIGPCFLASIIGDIVTHAWGIHHTIYPLDPAAVPALNPARVLWTLLAGICFGLVGMAFGVCTHAISRAAKRYVRVAPLRPVLGGLLVTIAVFGIGLSHTAKYIGLGIPTIVASFTTHVASYDFLGKFAFTTLTLGTGFKGGEVTPLFYIGSTLGNALSRLLPLPAPLLAGMGFVAVFSAAANTPVASTLMAAELFGAEAGVYAGLACVISYLISGHTGIYHAQKVGRSKYVSKQADEGLSLALVAKLQKASTGDLLDSLNDFGFIGDNTMEEISVLRLYFSASEMRKSDSWWRRFAPQTLGHFLLQQASEHGIEQALLHRVIGGYLNREQLVMDTGEIPPARLPQCLELVGREEQLQSFLKDNQDHLRRVRTVFLRGQEAATEAALEREELEEALRIEQAPSFSQPGKD